RVAGGDYTARAPVFRREDEVGQVALRFNEMASAIKEHIGKLEDRERAQRQFIADMAHEMKTPLTAIIGFSDLLRRHEMDGEGRQAALTAIASQGERLERLSLKLLSLSRLEGGTLPEMKQVKAAALFEQAGQALEPLLQAREVTLEVTERGQAFTCDPDLMASLLQNLLQNAVQASAPGHTVFLTAEDGGFTVRDEGQGIPREHLPRVKEPFYMADSSRSRAQGGAGLGLALCARIAELHQAQLQIDSEAGKGTTVQVRFTRP
ncbi:MAG TPA: HAMP domain-containing sensor histidine kinase, partial [Clostridia bacterium]|nr:HAMP domain-containing sensor histidine kinase [Clostridia bacterium]